MGYFRFFYTLRTFYRPVPYPMHNGDTVKNESARAKNKKGGPNAPPPACLGLNLEKKTIYSTLLITERFQGYRRELDMEGHLKLLLQFF